MNRCALLWLSIAVLEPAAYAAEPELAIELRDVELVLPSVAPPHFQKEGLPYLTENAFVIDLLTLIGSQDYEAALALAKEEHAAELALLEAGDPDGVLGGTRRAGTIADTRTRRQRHQRDGPLPDRNRLSLVGAIRARGGGAQSGARSAARLSSRARSARARARFRPSASTRRACI